MTKLADNDSVKALIVAIDSPGGSVAGGEGLHDAIARVAAKKPVVAVMGGTGGVGRLHGRGARRADLRPRGTLTGSIGVLLETGEVSGLLKSLGVSAEAITSGPLKDQPSFTQAAVAAGQGGAAGAGAWTCTTSSSAWSPPAGTWMPRGCANWPMAGPIPGGRR